MDRTIAATARAINILGDAALRDCANDLVRLARNVACIVDAPCNNLLLAAKGLDLALQDSTGRSAAVAVLRKAAANLEGALGTEIGAVRDAAARLASACSEHQNAANKIEETTERRDAEQSARWWSLIWGRRQRRCLEHGVRAHLLAEDQKIKIPIDEFLAEEATHQLKNSLHGFMMTSVVKLSAVHDDDEIAGVVDALKEAISALADGGVGNSELVIRVGKAATDVEGKLGPHIVALRGPATILVRACLKHQDRERAMAAVLRAYAEQRQRSDIWWRFRWLRQHFDKVKGIVGQNEVLQQQTVAPGQGDGRRSPKVGFDMLGCMTLVMPLIIGMEKKLKLFSHDKCIFVLICLWCGHVGD